MSAADDNIVLFRRAPAELNRRSLERFARTLRAEVARGAGFSCLIAGDSELRRLNRDFLGKDYPTDVLSFPDPSSPKMLGEMAISAARARAQAASFGHSLENEIRVLMLHGLLHLLGMDHVTDRGQMKRAEARWLLIWSRREGVFAGVRASGRRRDEPRRGTHECVRHEVHA
jgi:probable rRNA maturation factor